MIPTFDGQSDQRQFLMNFEAAIISEGDDETTLAKLLVMAVKRTSTAMVLLAKSKIHIFMGST